MTRTPPPESRASGAFELDLKTAELRRSGVRVKLQEQPFRLLAFLLQRPGEVVSREELRERLWPTDFVDFDHSLNTAIRKLRAALDDSADNPRFVETLARRGYRFIAPVTISGEATATPPNETPVEPPVAHAPSPPRRVGRMLAAAGIVAVVALTVFFVVRRRGTTARPEVAAIAVLPFINENPATEHLSDGLSEILIDSLSRMTDLRVMGRTTVFRFKGQPFDPQRIGRELKVAAIVIGTVRSDGDQQTIHVELIDTTDGSRMWGDRYETAGSNLPAVQSRISNDLSMRLRRGLDRTRSPLPRYSTNPEAYELYLKGLQAWNRRKPEELRRAVELFKGAIALDPGFAAAYAGLAQTYGVMTGYELLPSSEGAVLVLATARKALALDPESSDAYATMATTKFRNLWDFEGASADYRRALALNPSNATTHHWYGDYLRAMGRYAEASAETDRAWELDPSARPINSARCFAAFYERRYEEALSRVRTAESLDRAGNANRCLIAALLASGDYPGALAELDHGEVPEPTVVALRRAYRESGPEGFLRERLKILLSATGPPVDTTMDIAESYATLGETDAAFATLEDAYRRRVSRLTQFHFMPPLDSLRSDPRFEDLARRIGLPPEALAAADTLRRQRPYITK